MTYTGISMVKNCLFAYCIRWCTVLFLTLPLSAQTFSWTPLGTSAERKCLNLTVCYDGSILAGTDRGLFRSFNNGITWQQCGLDSFEIRCAAADSTGRLYVGGGKQYGRKGVYCSTDSGKSWKQCVVAIDSTKLNNYYAVTALLVVTNEILVAGTDGIGILRSTDHGVSWSKYTLPGDYAYQSVNALCATADGYLYAGAYATVLRSTDLGNTWVTKFKTSSYNYVLTPGHYADVFVFAMANNGSSYLNHSTDQGESWTNLGLGGYNVTGIVQDVRGKIFVSLNSSTSAALVKESTSQTWETVTTDSSFRDCSSIVITPDGHCLVGIYGYLGGGIYRSVSTIASPVIPSINIAQAIADTDHDFKPDRVGKTVTIVGVANGTNLRGTEATQYTLQDGSGGIQLFKAGSGGPILTMGDAVVVTGTIAQERGTTQIIPASFNDSVFHILGSNLVVTQTKLTVRQFMSEPERYESQLVKISGIAKHTRSSAWPVSGADANMVFWDGWDTMIVNINKNTILAGVTEPIYPANVSGVVTQYTSSALVYNDGYQLSPGNPTDFEGGIQVSPNPHFALVTPAKGATLLIDSTNQKFLFTWNKPVDLNGDPLAYRWVPIGGTAVATGGSPTGADSFLVRTGAQLLTFLGSKDTAVLKWTVQTKDQFPAIVSNVDTSFVKLIKGKTLNVKAMDNLLPTVFSLAQNYPNPFNPSTTISYQLPITGFVSLTVYDVLGREVATLVKETKDVGVYTTTFNAQSFSSGLYFYEMRSGSFVSVKKMLLMK